MNYVIETYCVLCTVKANKCVQNHRTKNSVVLYKHDSPPLPIFELSLKLLTLEKILNSFLVIESSFKSSSWWSISQAWRGRPSLLSLWVDFFNNNAYRHTKSLFHEKLDRAYRWLNEYIFLAGQKMPGNVNNEWDGYLVN